MGENYWFRVVIGVPVTEDPFFEVQPSLFVCSHGHPGKPGEAYCSHDGERFREVAVRRPKANLVEYLAGISPDDWWLGNDSPKDGPGIFYADPIQSAMCENPARALGVSLYRGMSESANPARQFQGFPITEEALSEARLKVQAAMTKLCIEGQIALYPVIYVPC